MYNTFVILVNIAEVDTVVVLGIGYTKVSVRFYVPALVFTNCVLVYYNGNIWINPGRNESSTAI
jgi:hypothetical protein